MRGQECTLPDTSVVKPDSGLGTPAPCLHGPLGVRLVARFAFTLTYGNHAKVVRSLTEGGLTVTYQPLEGTGAASDGHGRRRGSHRGT